MQQVRSRLRELVQRAAALAQRGLRGGGRALFNAIIRREPAHCVCPECKVDFVPELTESRCPICGWLAVERPKLVQRRPAERRLTAGLGFAWFAGAVIFALVAHFLYA